MEDNNPLRNYTIFGRLWIIVCLAGGVYVFILYVTEELPLFSPSSYPVALFLLPVAIGTVAIYGFGAIVFRLAGIRFKRKPPDDPH